MAAPMQENGEDVGLSLLQDFAELEEDPPPKRDLCKRCCRPITVCWCAYLPQDPLDLTTKVYIFQHPYEETRSLKTAPMLYHGLPNGHCHIYKGKRFSQQRYPELGPVLEDPNTLVLYPGKSAVDIEDIAKTNQNNKKFNLFLIDGTWHQAKGLFFHNEIFHKVKQVQLRNTGLSEYVIRTQPVDGALSTLETAAMAIATLENKPHIREILLKPLRALCDFQLQHGAVKHHSKQYLIENGLYTKKLPQNLQTKTIERKDEEALTVLKK